MQLGSSAPLLYVHSEQIHSDGALSPSMVPRSTTRRLLSSPQGSPGWAFSQTQTRKQCDGLICDLCKYRVSVNTRDI
jgi:hypothetical protein